MTFKICFKDPGCDKINFIHWHLDLAVYNMYLFKLICFFFFSFFIFSSFHNLGKIISINFLFTAISFACDLNKEDEDEEETISNRFCASLIALFSFFVKF